MTAFRHVLLCGASSLLLTTAAMAQDGTEVETVTTTGTRIIADGYEAPTPVTTITVTDLTRNNPQSIPEGLQALPQFVATTGPQQSHASAGSPQAGNYLNLRGLGAIETLTMVDGARLPATSFDGTVDANIIPQAFVSRVDVVTGSKCWQFATRFAYDGIGVDAVMPELGPALDRFLALPRPSAGRKTLIVNYEQMMLIRKQLGYLELEGAP